MRILLIVTALLQTVWWIAVWFAGYLTDWKCLCFFLVSTPISAALLGMMPQNITFRLKALKEYLVSKERFFLLVLSGMAFVIGVLYAIFRNPLVDEKYILITAEVISKIGIAHFFTQYSQITWFTTRYPPLMAMIYGFALRFFGNEWWALRLISLTFGIGTMLLTYYLAKKLYGRSVACLAALFFLSSPFFFHYGAAIYTDMPATFFFTLALFSFLSLLDRPRWRSVLFTGLGTAAALFTRYTTVLIYPIFLGSTWVYHQFSRIRVYLGIVLFLSFALEAGWGIYLYQAGILGAHIKVITYHAGAVLRDLEAGKLWIAKSLFIKFPSFLGIYNLPALLLGGLCFLRRKNDHDRFILLWIVMVILPFLVTFPNSRYFFPALPALAVVMACGLERFFEMVEPIILQILIYEAGTLYLFVHLGHR